MQRSKVFLHTSYYEGFSTVCLEALYAGAQVVSFVEAMERKIPHWHIVKSSREMIREILEILQSSGSKPNLAGIGTGPGEDAYPDRPPQPLLEYSMSDSVRAVMELFDYNETAI
jgi:glycosyltransferase involved in cell wall biosynthesis